jgi:hypothetical protein
MLAKYAGVVVTWFWNSKEARSLVVALLARYAASTDNQIDNVLVDFVRAELKV